MTTTLPGGGMPGSVIAILSHAVVDEIHSPGAAIPVSAVGGAGSYAAVGASLASSRLRSMIVSGVGSRDRDDLSRWFRDREVDPQGLFLVGRSSPRTVVRYDDVGERVETPSFGLEHFDAHTALPRHIPDVDAIAGTYLFHDTEQAYWDAIEDFRAVGSGPILWEMSASSALPARLPEVRRALASVDVLSINRTEAQSLLGTSAQADVVAGLAHLGVLTLLRLGSEGSLLIGHGADPIAIATAPADVVDATGGGNSYSGAFLAAWVETGDALHAAHVAAAVAAEIIGQYGAPVVHDALRSEVLRAAGALAAGRAART